MSPKPGVPDIPPDDLFEDELISFEEGHEVGYSVHVKLSGSDADKADEIAKIEGGTTPTVLIRALRAYPVARRTGATQPKHRAVTKPFDFAPVDVLVIRYGGQVTQVRAPFRFPPGIRPDNKFDAVFDRELAELVAGPPKSRR